MTNEESAENLRRLGGLEVCGIEVLRGDDDVVELTVRDHGIGTSSTDREMLPTTR